MCPAADGSAAHGTVWANLYERGAHFVLSKRYPFSDREQERLAQLADDPQPLKAYWAKLKKPRLWRETPASAEAAHAHVKRGGLVGIVPSSLACVVLDVDGGGTDAAIQVMQTLGMLMPVANMQSRRDDGRHLWFLLTDAEETSNRTEHPAFAPLKVDVRGSNGFVWLWEGEEGAQQLLKGINSPIDVVERKRWNARLDPPKPPPPAPSPPVLEPDEAPRHVRFLDKVIETKVTQIAQIREGGGRHTAVFAAAAECARHSAGRGEPIAKTEIFERLRGAALASGLRDDTELTRQLDRGWTEGLKEPRHPEKRNEPTPAGGPAPEEPRSHHQQDTGDPPTDLRRELVDLGKRVDEKGSVTDEHREELDELRVVEREISSEGEAEEEASLASKVESAKTDRDAFKQLERHFEEVAPPKPIGHWYDASLPPPVLWCCKTTSAATDKPTGSMLSVGEVTLLSGPGGLGKTTVCLAIATAAANGIASKTPQQACGLWVRPGIVVIQNHEDSPGRLQQKLKWYAEGRERAAWRHIYPIEDPKALWRMDRGASGESEVGEGWSRLWRVVKDVGANLVILDAAKYIFPGAPNADPGPIAEFYARLAEESKRAGCGVLIVAHDTKGARNLAKQGLDPGPGTVAGSASWSDSARGVLYLHRDKKHPDHKLFLQAIKANYGPSGWGALLALRLAPFRGVDPIQDRQLSADRWAKRKAPKEKAAREGTKSNGAERKPKHADLEGFD